MKIDCIAIDDEPLALDIIKDYARRIPYMNLVNTFDNALEAIDFLKNNTVQLMFLDIQMDELTGIQMLSVLKEKPLVVFTTAYDQYAIKGYELDATDYLLKPISFERFIKSTDKVYDRLSQNISQNSNSSTTVHSESKPDDYCFVKTEFHLEKVMINDILYIEGMGDYIMIHTTTRKIMTLQNFKKAEDTLPGDKFCRVHKSFMVALNKIESIERNRIKIGSALIPVSDSYKKVFYEMVEKRGMM